MLTGAVHGLYLFVLSFFGGLLIEGALNVMGALPLYNLPQFTIPAVWGAFGFLSSITYELSKRKDDEE
jgi:hypothetical protein